MGGIPNSGFLFRGAVASAATKYVPVPCSGGALVGILIGWKDATSSATITLQTTNLSEEEAPVETAGSAWQWANESLTITGPSGSAAGATMLHLGNMASKRARLKIVAAANCLFEITGHGKE